MRRRLAVALVLTLTIGVAPVADAAIIFKQRFGDPPPGDGTLSSPYDVAVDTGGDIFVVDQDTHRVQKYDDKGKFIFNIGIPHLPDGTHDQDGQLYFPQAIAIDPSGSFLYVADTSNSRVQVFSTTDGEFVRKWGEFGGGDGQLNNPGGIDVDDQGNVWVADTRNHRVQKFSSTGTFLDAFGSTDTTEGALGVPVGIAVDDVEGHVYVTDELSPASVVKFTDGGGFVEEFGVAPGTGSILNFPDEITIDEAGSVIYVIEAGGDGDGDGQEVSMFNLLGSGQSAFIDDFYGTDSRTSSFGFSPHGIFFDKETKELFVAAPQAQGKKIFRYLTGATPKLDISPDDSIRAISEDQKLHFGVRHDAMLGSCEVRGSGTIKIPESNPFFESSYDVEGGVGIVRAKRRLNYKIRLTNEELKAVVETRATVKITFRSPGGCNNGIETPDPVTVTYRV